jgi:hypothetical protein
MKPHPELIRLALQTLSRRPSDCVMIGDSVTDIEVSRTAGVRSIGDAERGDELVRAGADAITDDMASLAAAVELAACDVWPPHVGATHGSAEMSANSIRHVLRDCCMTLRTRVPGDRTSRRRCAVAGF